MARMPRFPAHFAGSGSSGVQARLLVRRVRRRWSMGGRGILREPSLQGLHTVVQLCHLVAQGTHIGLHSKRGLRPVLRRKGKRPDGVGRVRPWFHDVSSQQTTGSDCWTFYSGDMIPAPEENARRTPSTIPTSGTGYDPVIAYE